MRMLPLAALVAVCTSVPATGDDELLQGTIAQHKAARESIRTFTADYEYKKIHPKASTAAAGRYTRTPKSVFITNGTEGVGTVHTLARDGEVRIVGRGWKESGTVEHNGGRSSATRMYSPGDVWIPLCLCTEGPRGEIMPFDELYARAKRPPQASKVTLDGRECVKVQAAYDVTGSGGKDLEINRTAWHDVQRNYLVVRNEYRQVGYDILHSHQVLEFQEPTPGVIVPVRSQLKMFNGSELLGEWDVAVRNVRVNADISEQSLTLPRVPRGTLVHDMIKEQQYAIDADWNQVGPAKHMPVTMAQTTVPGGKLFDQPSESEPPSLWQWIILASAVVFGVAVLWFGLRFLLLRLRASKTPSAG